MVVKIVILTEPLNSYPLATKIENSLHFHYLIFDRIWWQITVSVFILNVETFSTKILTLVKTFIIFLFHNRMISQPLFLKDFHTIIVLNITYKSFCHCFHLTMSINLIYIPIRMENICFTDLTTTLKCQVEKKNYQTYPKN